MSEQRSDGTGGFVIALGLFVVAGFGVAIGLRSPAGTREDDAVVVEGPRTPQAQLGASGEPVTETADVDETAPVAKPALTSEPLGPAEEYVTGTVKRDEMGGLTVQGVDGEPVLKLTPGEVGAARWIPADPFAPGGASSCLDLGDGRRVPVPAEVGATLPKTVTYNRADEVNSHGHH